MSEQMKNRTKSTTPVDPHERREHARYPFIAMVEAVENKTHARVSGHTSDLSLGGCYVNATTSFPAGSLLKLRLTKDQSTFEAQAVVVYSLIDMGMGVKFVSAEPEQLRIIEQWIGELSGEPGVEVELIRICDQTYPSTCPEGAEFQVLKELVIELSRQGLLSTEKSGDLLQKLAYAGRPLPAVSLAEFGVN